jgi:hypothetical protein
MSDEAPKSAFELAMQRLQQKDRESGTKERPLTDGQRARIAEIRAFYEAKLAEIEILSGADRARARDAESLERIEAQYRGERERLLAERERKLEAERGAPAQPESRS